MIARAESRGVHGLAAIGHYSLGEVWVRMALREGKAGWAEVPQTLRSR